MSSFVVRFEVVRKLEIKDKRRLQYVRIIHTYNTIYSLVKDDIGYILNLR